LEGAKQRRLRKAPHDIPDALHDRYDGLLDVVLYAGQVDLGECPVTPKM
jgi:hypothetical protein